MYKSGLITPIVSSKNKRDSEALLVLEWAALAIFGTRVGSRVLIWATVSAVRGGQHMGSLWIAAAAAATRPASYVSEMAGEGEASL